jgi:hypothetical protein
MAIFISTKVALGFFQKSNMPVFFFLSSRNFISPLQQIEVEDEK